MKKLLVSVFSVALVLVVGSSVVKAQGSAADILGITVEADGNIFIGVSKPEDKKDTTYSGITYGTNLIFTKSFSDQSKVVLALRGGDNTANIESLGLFRGDINDNGYSYGDIGDTAWLKEFYFVQPIADNLASITLGKVEGLLSENEGVNSVGSFFTNDATVDNVDIGENQDNPYTLKIAVNPIPILSITYGYSTQKYLDANNFKDPFSNGFNSFEIKYTGIEEGNYRVGFWFSNQKNPNYKDGEEDGDRAGAMGIWFSGDQVLAKHFTVFARFGYRLDSTCYAFAAVHDTYLIVPGMNAQIGTTISGELFGRSADKVFVGIGLATALSAALPKDTNVTDLHAEINYSYQVNDSIALIPFFQFANTSDNFPPTADTSSNIVGMAAGIYTNIKF
jgi:hypothetical protein